MTSQRFETFFARATVNLKDGVVKAKETINTKMTGIKRGNYNVEKKRKRDDNVNVMKSSIFEDETVIVEGITYIDLLLGGHIPVEIKSLYLYTKCGISPDEWVSSLVDCQSQSKTRVEQAKHAKH